MTGPEHYREAQRLLSESSFRSPSGQPKARNGENITWEQVADLRGRAQVHATLALAAAAAVERSDQIPSLLADWIVTTSGGTQ